MSAPDELPFDLAGLEDLPKQPRPRPDEPNGAGSWVLLAVALLLWVAVV